MAKKLRSVNARLQKALRVRKLLANPKYFHPKYHLPPVVPTGLLGPSRDDIRKATAVEAIKLTAQDGIIKKVFDTFGLDPNDPWHWRELVEELASIVFERKSAGRRKEWTSERKERLLSAVEAKQKRNPRPSDEQACKQLAGAKDSPPYFRKAGTGGLLKQLQFARAETGRRSASRSKTSS